MYSKDTEMVDMEASLLQCVNPHEVNPLPGADKGTEYLINFNVTNVEITESGQIHDPLKKVKLEMEEFKDLSVFLPTSQPTTSSDNFDELNTPVFDKDAFDFPVMPMKSTPYDHKLNSEIFNPYSTQQNKDLINRQLQQENPFSNISNIQQNNDISYTNQPTESNIYYSDCESPPYELSHSSFQSYTNMNTPEDSNSSNNSAEGTTQLYLNVNLNQLTEATTIDTPDVINTVVELDNFNILDIVQAEEIKTVDVDDIFSPYVKPENISDNTKRSRRRRKLSYDSDDEYVPPTKSSRKTEDSSDSDSDYEQPTTKRGRTRKVPATEGATKYREIRDKNNEASRKSRQKRKQKEQELERECEELNAKNIKLKAQVEELEKTVTSYRDNLFKIMLRK